MSDLSLAPGTLDRSRTQLPVSAYFDAALFEQLAPLFGEYFRAARPAATAMIVGLVDPRMKIEIEVTAKLR